MLVTIVFSAFESQFPLLCNLEVISPFKAVLRLLFSAWGAWARASRGVSWGQAQGLQPQAGPMLLLSVNRLHPHAEPATSAGESLESSGPSPQSLDLTRLSFFPPGTRPQTACPALILDET